MRPSDDDEHATLGQIDADIGAMAPMMGLDGMPGPPAQLAEPPPSAPMTPETSPCMRGPCRHFMRLVSRFDAGNPSGTFEPGREPRHVAMFCSGLPGQYIEMSSDSFALDCNRWDPIPPSSLVALEKRREAYYEANPEHRPLTSDEIASMVDEQTGDADDKEPA
jgi:hypothetical protein